MLLTANILNGVKKYLNGKVVRAVNDIYGDTRVHYGLFGTP
jgi:hypothetical protein